MSNEPDFHVSELHYKLEKIDTTTYQNPPDVEFETAEARFKLSDGRLKCEMKVHTSSPQQAQVTITPILKAWEVNADLSIEFREFRFAYDHPVIVDRRPPAPGVIQGAIMAGFARVRANATGVMRVTRTQYPSPPGAFRATGDAESMWFRYGAYVQGREPLLSMAYFCFTVLSASGGAQKAAAKYRIDYRVLKKLSELSSTRGDRTTARKLKPGMRPLTNTERHWLEKTIKLLILRVGDTRPRSALPIITLADLPNSEVLKVLPGPSHCG